MGEKKVLLLLEILQNWVDILERLVDFCSHLHEGVEQKRSGYKFFAERNCYLGSSQHNFARHKDEEHNTWLHHPTRNRIQRRPNRKSNFHRHLKLYLNHCVPVDKAREKLRLVA